MGGGIMGSRCRIGIYGVTTFTRYHHAGACVAVWGLGFWVWFDRIMGFSGSYWY